jgi:ankyrin repeat protein
MSRKTLAIGCILLTPLLVGLGVWYASTSMHRKLIRAIQAGDNETANRVLTDGQFDFTASDHFGRTALLQCMASNNKAIYVELLERRANPNLCNSRGICVINEAAAAADSIWLAEALAHGGDPNAPNTGNRYYPNSTPIFYAIDARRIENAKLLIKAGADVNHIDGHGEILLRHAFLGGRTETVIDLLEAGADPLKKDGIGKTFVDLIRQYDEKIERTEEGKAEVRKVRAILIARGLLEPTSEELSAAQGTRTPDSP